MTAKTVRITVHLPIERIDVTTTKLENDEKNISASSTLAATTFTLS